MKKILLIVAVITLFNFQFSILNSQDTNYMRQTLRTLTSERMKGRGYSFRGDSIAAEFIRGELRRLKVKPLAENYFQPYTFSVHSMEGPVSMKVNGMRIEPYTQFRVPAWSKSTWGDYPIVKVPCETLLDVTKFKKFLNKYRGRLDESFVYIDCTSFSPKDELIALLKYMAGHNASHIREMAELAGVKILVVLRVWVTTDEVTYINHSGGIVAECQANGKIACVLSLCNIYSFHSWYAEN